MPSSPHPITLALSSDFLKAFESLPRGIQGKVRSFISKFQADPTSSALNYEKIHTFKDPNVRSVRVDEAYRAIVLQPARGHVYMLLWVDHHDRAYQWAEPKRFDIHPETGSLQVYEATHAEDAPSEPDPTQAPRALFDLWRDRQLMALGVPDGLLPLVRAFQTIEQLEAAQAFIPEEAYEALYLLASGFDYDDIWRELDYARNERAVDTTDFASALDHPDTLRRFHVIESEFELARILNAPLEQWRIFLHPTQRRLVSMHANGPVRVLGGAGTGKTVVAMHRAAFLADRLEAEEPGGPERVLFTTFTRNLAEDIRQNLEALCDTNVMRRIEVINLDQWVVNLLRRHDYGYEIDYGVRAAPLWQDALNLAPAELNLSPGFYRQEWEAVVLAQGITNQQDYLQASRIGRGHPLSRKERLTVWQVFAEYRALLHEQRLKERDDAFHDAALLLRRQNQRLPYRHLVVDEAQDMGGPAFRLLRAILPEQPDDLFIVGDAHQRIYRHRVVLGQCGIAIRGRSRRLRINYRTTEENRRWAVALLEGLSIDDLDGGQDTLRGYTSLMHGPVPEVRLAESFRDELSIITSQIQQLIDQGFPPSAICLVTRTNDLCLQYEGGLKANGVETHLVSRNAANDARRAGVRIATMHRVKGLEFEHVIISGVNEGRMPLRSSSSTEGFAVDDPEHDDRERSLLYVAATRARRTTLITAHGKPSPFLLT